MKNIIALAILSVLGTPQLFAQTINFDANAVLNASCTLGYKDINFANVTPQENASPAYYQIVSPISATCTKGTNFVIKLSTGHGTYTERYMKSSDGSDKLFYNVYNSVRPEPFGDGSAGTRVHAFRGTGNTDQYAFSVRVPKNQFVTPDNYSDILTLTIEY